MPNYNIKDIIIKGQGEIIFICHHIQLLKILALWGGFPSLYSQFYKVIMLESTNVTSEGKMQVYF